MLLIENFGGVRKMIINQDVALRVGNPFAPKSMGGLGIKKMEDMNRALVAKMS